MPLSALADKSNIPKESDLAAVLVRTFSAWNKLKTIMASTYAPLDEEWNCATKDSGWALRLKHKKRTVLYMIPGQKHFLAALVLGDKAVKAAHESDLPKFILDLIDSARKYAEGRGIRLEVRNAKDLRAIEKLAAIKMAN